MKTEKVKKWQEYKSMSMRIKTFDEVNQKDMPFIVSGAYLLYSNGASREKCLGGVMQDPPRGVEQNALAREAFWKLSHERASSEFRQEKNNWLVKISCGLYYFDESDKKKALSKLEELKKTADEIHSKLCSVTTEREMFHRTKREERDIGSSFREDVKAVELETLKRK